MRKRGINRNRTSIAGNVLIRACVSSTATAKTPVVNHQKPDRIIAAADYFNADFRRLLATERGIHLETLIASSARMAGTMLFRSFAFPGGKFEPGTTVLSEEAPICMAVFEVV